MSYVTWGSASALSEGFIQNPGNAFSFSSGSEGMGLNLEEESMVEGDSSTIKLGKIYSYVVVKN